MGKIYGSSGFMSELSSFNDQSILNIDKGEWIGY